VKQRILGRMAAKTNKLQHEQQQVCTVAAIFFKRISNLLIVKLPGSSGKQRYRTFG
jgi:hypothetical protein